MAAQPIPANNSFLMTIESVFTVPTGTVVMGTIARGEVQVGDAVEIVGLGPTQQTTIAKIEKSQQQLTSAQAGNSGGLGILLPISGVKKGQVLAFPGSITSQDTFKADLYLLTEQEGGRQTPILSGFSPQFIFWNSPVQGTISLPTGIDTIAPGTNVSINVTLTSPIAIENGVKFAILQGGKTIGTGIVTKS